MDENFISVNDFALSFGVSPDSFSSNLKAEMKRLDFSYSLPNPFEEKKLILEVIKKIEGDTQIVGAKGRTKVWDDGWRENLDSFRSFGLQDNSLVPKFVRPGNPIRWQQQYIIPTSPEFELQFLRVYLQWFAETYFADVDTIHEFGCGTGYNLLKIADFFPTKKFKGSDFVPSSVQLVNEISEASLVNLSSTHFDMLEPDPNYLIGDNDAVFTFGALEQLAGKFQPMINFLISKGPRIVVHTEPVEEFYDKNILEDYLAFSFQSKRGYTSGLISFLKDLENKGLIEIIKFKRLFFGSFFMEGYNHISWRPVTHT